MAAAATNFDPTIETVQEKDGDTILLYVPVFKKGQMRVQLTSTNLVRVSGEKERDGGKPLHFRKEFLVKPNTDTNRISAKLEKGRLQLKLPNVDDQLQESAKTTNSTGKGSNQKKFNSDTRNANDDNGNAAAMASLCAVVGLVGVGLYFPNVEKSQT